MDDRRGARGAGAGLHSRGIGGRRSPLHDCPALDRVARRRTATPARLLAQLRVQHGPVVAADRRRRAASTTSTARSPACSARGRRDLHVVAAARADSLRSLYGHWTQEIRKSKVGVLLRPNIDYDGELVGATLPRRAPVQMTVGRGYLAHSGGAEFVQFAAPGGYAKNV